MGRLLYGYREDPRAGQTKDRDHWPPDVRDLSAMRNLGAAARDQRRGRGSRPGIKQDTGGHVMEEIAAFISAHWLEWVFTVALGILSWAYRSISFRLKAEQKKNEAIAAGVQSLLRESIVENYNKYTEKGYCPIYAKESIKKVYAAYHGLDGNDVATELYHKLLAMKETA